MCRHHDVQPFQNAMENVYSDLNGKTLPPPTEQAIVPFHKDFSPSGEQLEHRNLAHEL